MGRTDSGAIQVKYIVFQSFIRAPVTSKKSSKLIVPIGHKPSPMPLLKRGEQNCLAMITICSDQAAPPKKKKSRPIPMCLSMYQKSLVRGKRKLPTPPTRELLSLTATTTNHQQAVFIEILVFKRTSSHHRCNGTSFGVHLFPSTQFSSAALDQSTLLPHHCHHKV